MSGDYLLSFVADKDGSVIHVHADSAGLGKLISALEDLRNKVETGVCEHEHLISQEWAGAELTSTMLASERDSGSKQIHHVKLFAWTPEWREKHGL